MQFVMWRQTILWIPVESLSKGEASHKSSSPMLLSLEVLSNANSNYKQIDPKKAHNHHTYSQLHLIAKLGKVGQL